MIDSVLNDLFTHLGCDHYDVVRFDRPEEMRIGWKCVTCGWDETINISDIAMVLDNSADRWRKLLASPKGRQAIAMIANKHIAVWDEVELPS